MAPARTTRTRRPADRAHFTISRSGWPAKGVASLRYVKRTAVVPEQFAPDRRFTLREETIDDARAAVALLVATALVDPSRVWVVGHSLGGYLAPRIAEGNPQVAGIVVLAGPTRPMENLVIEQTRYLYLSRGDADHGAARVAKAEAAARAVRDPGLADGTVVDFLGAKLPGSYFLDMRRYHPAALATSLSIPTLVLQSGRDFHVGRADYDGWAKALGGHLAATLKLYPTLNHLFEAGSGPPGPEEYGHPDQHMAEDVVADSAKCIAQSPARPSSTRLPPCEGRASSRPLRPPARALRSGDAFSEGSSVDTLSRTRVTRLIRLTRWLYSWYEDCGIASGTGISGGREACEADPQVQKPALCRGSERIPRSTFPGRGYRSDEPRPGPDGRRLERVRGPCQPANSGA
jgi:dienelactone hydrolase